jgi:transcriptional regulator with AAA-type ATPase domain
MLQRFRTLCAVLRQGFDLCSARERPLEPAPGTVERAIEPLIPGFVCASAAMQRVTDLIQRLQGSDLTVLITGESGTGKDLVARAIHAGSPRGQGVYLPYNCTSATRELADSQLFGHQAARSLPAPSPINPASSERCGGTIFLDESATCRSTCSRSCCGSSSRENPPSAKRARFASTCASSPRRTRISSSAWRKDASAKISSTASV